MDISKRQFLKKTSSSLSPPIIILNVLVIGQASFCECAKTRAKVEDTKIKKPGMLEDPTLIELEPRRMWRAVLMARRRQLVHRLFRCRLDRLLELRRARDSRAKHADRAEFHCPRKFISAARTGALGIRGHCAIRPSAGPRQKHAMRTPSVGNLAT